MNTKFYTKHATARCDVCGQERPMDPLSSPLMCVECSLTFAQADIRAANRREIRREMRQCGIPLAGFGNVTFGSRD